MYVYRNIEELSPNHFCRARNKNYTYSECVLYTNYSRAKPMRHIFVCGLSRSTIFVHNRLVRNDTIFGKNVTDSKTSALNFYKFLDTFQILRRIQNYCKYT